MESTGGFPYESVGEEQTGVWCTVCVLFLHRTANFLTEKQVNNLCKYLLWEFNIYKHKTGKLYGWSSLPLSYYDPPIPIITCVALLSLCSLHIGHKRISKLFKLTINSVLQMQKNNGLWEDEADYYSNMYAIKCLYEVKYIFDKDQNIKRAINDALNNAKSYFSDIDISCLEESQRPFYYIIANYLSIRIEEYILPETIELKKDYKRENVTYWDKKNFAFSKYSIPYYLHLAAIDDSFYFQHHDFIDDIIRHIFEKKQDSGFWYKEKDGRKEDCVWLTCDIIRMLYTLNYKRNTSRKSLYYGTCAFNFTPPWYIFIIQQIKYCIKIIRILRGGGSVLQNYLGDGG